MMCSICNIIEDTYDSESCGWESLPSLRRLGCVTFINSKSEWLGQPEVEFTPVLFARSPSVGEVVARSHTCLIGCLDLTEDS